MTEAAHTLERDWRVPRVAAHEADALEIRDALTHLEPLADRFDYDKKEAKARAIRATIGLLKSEASDSESLARQLEAQIAS